MNDTDCGSANVVAKPQKLAVVIDVHRNSKVEKHGDEDEVEMLRSNKDLFERQ